MRFDVLQPFDMIPKPKPLGPSLRAVSDTTMFQRSAAASPPYSPQIPKSGAGGAAPSLSLSLASNSKSDRDALLSRGGTGDLKSAFGSGGLNKTTRFADDMGSVSDSGAVPSGGSSRSKFKRTRRALHLKASDRERLNRGSFAGLDWRKRSLAIEVRLTLSLTSRVPPRSVYCTSLVVVMRDRRTATKRIVPPPLQSLRRVRVPPLHPKSCRSLQLLLSLVVSRSSIALRRIARVRTTIYQT